MHQHAPHERAFAHLDTLRVVLDGLLQLLCVPQQHILLRQGQSTQRRAASAAGSVLAAAGTRGGGGGGGDDGAGRHQAAQQHQLLLHLPQPVRGVCALRELPLQHLGGGWLCVVLCVLAQGEAPGMAVARRQSSLRSQRTFWYCQLVLHSSISCSIHSRRALVLRSSGAEVLGCSSTSAPALPARAHTHTQARVWTQGTKGLAVVTPPSMPTRPHARARARARTSLAVAAGRLCRCGRLVALDARLQLHELAQLAPRGLGLLRLALEHGLAVTAWWCVRAGQRWHVQRWRVASPGCSAGGCRRCISRPDLLLVAHRLVLLQGRVLALRVAAQLQHLALTLQPPLPACVHMA
jgi:hypothetical protein